MLLTHVASIKILIKKEKTISQLRIRKCWFQNPSLATYGDFTMDELLSSAWPPLSNL